MELKVRRNYFISNISLQMWFRCQATIVLTSPLFEKKLEIIQKFFHSSVHGHVYFLGEPVVKFVKIRMKASEWKRPNENQN